MTDKEQKLVKDLKELIRHCWVHSGYEDCGFRQMTTEQQFLYEVTIGRKRIRRPRKKGRGPSSSNIFTRDLLDGMK